jgi:hypothetical protein
VRRSFSIKGEASSSIDSSIKSPGTLIRRSVREGLPTGRPELEGALKELDIIPGYIVSWKVNLLHFSSTVSSLAVSLPVYVWGLRGYRVGLEGSSQVAGL